MIGLSLNIENKLGTKKLLKETKDNLKFCHAFVILISILIKSMLQLVIIKILQFDMFYHF